MLTENVFQYENKKSEGERLAARNNAKQVLSFTVFYKTHKF